MQNPMVGDIAPNHCCLLFWGNAGACCWIGAGSGGGGGGEMFLCCCCDVDVRSFFCCSVAFAVAQLERLIWYSYIIDNTCLYISISRGL